MIFVKHGTIMSHIDLKFFTGIALRQLNFFLSGITMNWSKEKRIRLVYMSHVIKMIAIISPKRFSNIFFLYQQSIVINHISYVLRILMDNIILNYHHYNIFYRTIFCVNDAIDDTPS